MLRKVSLVVAMTILLGGGAQRVGAQRVGAQFRLDATLSFPFLGSFNASGIPVLPLVQVAYQFGGKNVHVGVGFSALTYVVSNMIWPDAYLEVESGLLAVRLDVGGGLVLVLPAPPDTVFHSPPIIPQLDISWKLASWFRPGGGVLVFGFFQPQLGMSYQFYLGARFIPFGGGARE